MRAVLKAHGVTDRKIWVADSFEGLPPPNVARYPDDGGITLHSEQILRVTIDTVRGNFETYGLLDEQVVFLKGWFKDTLPAAPIERLAIIRLDGDMYESTIDALRALYPKLSQGGFVIVDDYGGPQACRKAVDDYRMEHRIISPIHEIDWTGVYWQKATPSSCHSTYGTVRCPETGWLPHHLRAERSVLDVNRHGRADTPEFNDT
jgi:O-methyltransferase